MNERLFQDVFDKLQEGLPKGWKKISFYASYSQGSYSMKYFVDFGEGKYTDCFGLGYSNMYLMKLFVEINKRIEPVRMELQERERWNVMTMLVASDGNFKTEFDYSENNSDFLLYEREWKKNYLF